MTPSAPTRRRSKTPPPGETGQEALYLRSLSERQVTVAVKLRDGETVRGWIEYFDDGMLRLTREGKPNLFIYKQQIQSITEAGRRRNPRAGNGMRDQRSRFVNEIALCHREAAAICTPGGSRSPARRGAAARVLCPGS